jgi:hypothetical protein
MIVYSRSKGALFICLSIHTTGWINRYLIPVLVSCRAAPDVGHTAASTLPPVSTVRDTLRKKQNYTKRYLRRSEIKPISINSPTLVPPFLIHLHFSQSVLFCKLLKHFLLFWDSGDWLPCHFVVVVTFLLDFRFVTAFDTLRPVLGGNHFYDTGTLHYAVFISYGPNRRGTRLFSRSIWSILL